MNRSKKQTKPDADVTTCLQSLHTPIQTFKMNKMNNTMHMRAFQQLLYQNNTGARCNNVCNLQNARFPPSHQFSAPTKMKDKKIACTKITVLTIPTPMSDKTKRFVVGDRNWFNLNIKRAGMDCRIAALAQSALTCVTISFLRQAVDWPHAPHCNLVRLTNNFSHLSTFFFPKPSLPPRW